MGLVGKSNVLQILGLFVKMKNLIMAVWVIVSPKDFVGLLIHVFVVPQIATGIMFDLNVLNKKRYFSFKIKANK